ncbi:MAG: ATPase, T2SS/T4P/T4SS family [Nitrososphaerota archaeon]
MMAKNLAGSSIEDALASNPHLAIYLDEIVDNGAPQPDYFVQLSRELRYLERINIIYPIGDPYFIHIYTDELEGKNIYRVIQPEVPKDAWSCLQVVEETLAARLMDIEPPRNKEELSELLKNILEEVIIPDESLDRKEHVVIKRRGLAWSVRMNPLLAEAVKHAVLIEKAAMGIIEPLIRDPYIEDVSCPGVGPIFVEHKIFGSCRTTIEFRDEDELNQFVYKLSIKAGRPVSIRTPISDAMLPDGSRINIVYGSDISRRGSNFTIRKFSDIPISITQLIRWNTISAKAAAYLWLLLENNLNVWFVGETASGKTTLLRAAAVFVRPDAKIVSIEDVPEIVVPHDNWVCEVTRRGQREGEGVELFDLLKAALRQRPNYILVGEIRGAEAAIAFQAMQCVDDAYVPTDRGVFLLSELYQSLRKLGEEETSHGRIVRPHHGLRVYSTMPGLQNVVLADCLGLVKQYCRETVRITASDGLSVRVSPNHRFIVKTPGGEAEVQASELLRIWASGERWVRLARRRLEVGSVIKIPPEKFLMPLSIDDALWMMGRLLGGDFLQKRRGKYYWYMQLDSDDSLKNLTELLRKVGWRGEVERRGNALCVISNIPERLVHWAYIRGSATPFRDYVIGTARGLHKNQYPSFIRGVLSASKASARNHESLRLSLAQELSIELRHFLGSLTGSRENRDRHASFTKEEYVEILDELIDSSPEILDANETVLNNDDQGVIDYLRCAIGESGIAAANLWLAGYTPHVYSEKYYTYIYLPVDADVWVTSVEPGGGAEVYDLVLAGGGYYIGGTPSIHPLMDTGHGVLSTFHAGSVQKLIQRLTGSPIEIPKTYIDNLNAVAIQSAVRHPKTGRLERRVISINEILGLDSETGAINFVEVFTWNPSSDLHEFRGEGTSALLEDKVAKISGLSRREVRKIYAELNRRADFLKSLVEMRILSYRKVYQAISAAYKFGVEEAEKIVSETIEPDEA